MQDKIIDHLKNTYDPDVIILHGSRARGMNRENSDWDFILLYANETFHKSGRQLFAGQNIEVSIFMLPITDIIKTFSTKLQEAIVVFEKERAGTDLLGKAKVAYSQKADWSKEKINNHKLWFQGRVEGMRDVVNDPVLFVKYFSDLYPRIIFWYLILQQRDSQSIYVAVLDIQKKDSEYFKLLNFFSNPETSF